MRCLILLFVLIICMKEGFGDDGMTRMSGFGINMMTVGYVGIINWQYLKRRESWIDVIWYSATGTTKTLALTMKTPAVNAGSTAKDSHTCILSKIITFGKIAIHCGRRPANARMSNCSLLLSKKEGSNSICAELCGFHFSYSNKEREAYEKEIKELFHTFLKNARFRLV
ncbi:hypothetical protein PRIPAC_75913 [Pristionchus pacificus]|uniref:Uncharacterized protein n=1 Tax=Pristionchus pacificus TaxID=54126 RepID=A0A2A6CFM3_PRIPA|nr:hypothetical protein PRIPAC_75913 [Pristionchus pacificus]|eukprot:PDM76811.1 hypothetical protein PRIPAC_42206 [Pristionchus pacificus]